MKLQRAFFLVIALAFVVSLGTLLTGGDNQKAQVVSGTNSIALTAPAAGTTVSVGQTLPMTCQVEVAPGYGLSRLKFSWFQNNGAETGDLKDNQYDPYLSSGTFTENVTIPNITPGSNFKLQCVGYYKDLSNLSVPAISKTQSLAMNLVTAPVSVPGCMDPLATNYNPNATVSDGSCTYPTADATPPSIPTNLTFGLSTSNSILLNWNASTDNVGVVKYEIYRSTVNSTTVDLVAPPFAIVDAPSTTFLNQGLTSGTYRYQIKAVDAAGNKSNPSTKVAKSTIAVVRPTNLATSNPTQSTITLSWTTPASGQIYDYEIYASTTTNVGTSPVAIIPASGANNTTFTHVFESNANITLQPNTTYYFKVKARDPSANKSAFATKVGSNSATLVNGKTLAVTVPAPTAPTGLNVSSTGATTATATWVDNSTNETGFTLQRATNSGFTSNLTTVSSTIPANTQSFGITGLSSGVTYYFRVRANASTPSGWSTFGPLVVATADTTPPTISSTGVDISDDVNWILPAGTTETILTVTTNENSACKWNTADTSYASMTGSMAGAATVHTATLSGLINGTSYTRYVRCQDTAGNAMTTSRVVTFSVAMAPDTTAPAIPTLTVGAVTSTTVALSWNAVTDASSPVSYRIYRNGTYIGSPISGTSMTDGQTTPLIAGTTYSYTISACDSAPTSNCSAQSVAVSTTTTALPTIVSSLEIVRTNGTSVSTLASGQQLNVGQQVNATYPPLNAPVGVTPTSFSIKANPGTPAPTSIKFDLTGPSGFTAYTQCESTSPFALFGDASGTYTSWPTATQILGAYTLTVTPYAATTCTGAAGTPIVSQFILANFDDLTNPTNPSQANATYRSSGEIRLSWTASSDSSGISHYNVTRTPGGIVNVGNQTTYVDTNGLNGTTGYTYTVTAVDNVGNSSGVSNAVVSPTLSTTFSNADLVQTNEASVEVKASPDAPNGIGFQTNPNSAGTITNAPTSPTNPVWIKNEGDYWYVNFNSGLDGWVNESKIDSYIPPPPPPTDPVVNTTCPATMPTIEYDARNAARLTVQLCAQISESSTPKTITLKWANVTGRTVSSITIYRKTETGSWTSVGTPAASSTSWTDTNVTAGTYYEYKVQMVTGGSEGTVYGYIASGIKVPQESYRGRLVLVVDNTKANGLNGSAPTSGPLATQVSQLINELTGDKWIVSPVYVSQSATPATVRALIKGYYDTDAGDGNSNTNTKAVYIFGHVPVAGIGNLNPDGHGGRGISSDVIYSEMTSTWNTGSVGSSAGYGVSAGFTMPSTHTYNNPTPDAGELQVGRVDMYNLPGMPGTENEKLTNYLAKATNFKKRLYTPTDTMYLRARTPFTSSGMAGWSSTASVVGPQNVTHDRTASDLWTNLGQNHLFVLGYGQSGGVLAVDKIPQPGLCISGCGSNNLTSVSWGGVFNALSSSYIVEWNDTNSILRSILADEGKSLTMSYGIDNHWYFHHMGMGKTVGYSALSSLNNNTNLYYPRGMTGDWNNSSNGNNAYGHMALLGDPTLRAHYVGMPTGNLSITNSGGLAAFSWGASSDSPLGYNLYEIQTNTIRKVNSNIISGTSYTSSDSYDANRKYMVTAVKVRAGNSGTYYNESLGLIGGGDGGGVLLGDLDNPTWSGGTSNLTVTSPTATSLATSWNTATDATQPVTYKLQRRASGGSFAEVYSGTATSFSNTGLVAGTTYEFQVRACDGVGIPNCTSWSSTVSGTTTANDTTSPTTPGAPTSTGITASSISLSWTASTDAVGVTGYKIYRSATAGGTYSEVGTSATNSYTDTGLSASTSYYYKISAYDAAANNSAQSNASAAITTSQAQSGGQTVSGINGPVGPSLTTNQTSCTNPSGGTIYYVDAVNGNDSNNGTSVSTAWKTITKVNNSMSSINAGMTLCFKRGQTHRGKLSFIKSGTSTSPIIIDAYGTGSAPVISGNVLVTNWTQHSGNIWKATLSSAPVTPPKYLFVNSDYQTMARQPNTGWYYTEARAANSLTDTNNSWLSSQSANSLTGANIFMRAVPWASSVILVTGNSGSTINGERWDDLTPGVVSGTPTAIKYGTTWSDLAWGYFLRNKVSFIDTPGEWAFDSATNTVYLWAPGSANPNNLTVELSSEAEGIYLNTASYVKVRNLIVEGQTTYAIRMSSNRGVTLENNEIRNAYIGVHQYFTSSSYTTPNLFSNNHIHDINTAGLSLNVSGSGDVVEGNVVENISTVEDRIFSSDMTHIGILPPNNNGTTRRNIIRDIGWSGIAASGSGLITENLIERTMKIHTDGAGITFDNTDGLVMSKNIVKDTGVGSGQYAGTTAGPGATTNMVSMPLIYDTYSAKDKAFYIGDGSAGGPAKNYTIDGNIIINATDGIWMDHPSGVVGNKVINNIIYDFNRAGIGLTNYSMNRSLPCESPSANNSPCFRNYDDTITGNKIYGVASYQNPLYSLQSWSNGAGAVVDWGTFNNNYYYNPFRTGKIYEVRNFGTGENQWTLAQWQAARSEDLNSTSSNYTLTNTNQKAQIFYNATGSPITQSVNGCNANGTPLTGNQTIQPFTALVVEYGNC